MPSDSAAPRHSSELWASYQQFLWALRPHAVWRHDQDGEQRADGRPYPPRFVAVVEDREQLAAFGQRAAALADLTVRWPVQVFPEVWGWARLAVNAAPSTRRFPVGEWVALGAVTSAEMDAAAAFIERMRAAGVEVKLQEQDGGEALRARAPFPLTVRLSTGDAWRLRAYSPEGALLHRVAVGAVVVAGLSGGVHVGTTPRKSRKDRLEQLGTWSGVSLWRPSSTRA